MKDGRKITVWQLRLMEQKILLGEGEEITLQVVTANKIPAIFFCRTGKTDPKFHMKTQEIQNHSQS